MEFYTHLSLIKTPNPTTTSNRLSNPSTSRLLTRVTSVTLSLHRPGTLKTGRPQPYSLSISLNSTPTKQKHSTLVQISSTLPQANSRRRYHASISHRTTLSPRTQVRRANRRRMRKAHRNLVPILKAPKARTGFLAVLLRVSWLVYWADYLYLQLRSLHSADTNRRNVFAYMSCLSAM